MFDNRNETRNYSTDPFSNALLYIMQVIHNDFNIHDDFLLPTMHIIKMYYIKLEIIIY